MGDRGRGEREGETLDMPSGELLLLWIWERRKGRKGGEERRGEERRGEEEGKERRRREERRGEERSVSSGVQCS